MPPHRAAWPARRIAWWALLALGMILWQGRGWLQDLRPDPDRPVDFYQEWASARNFLSGLPIYEPQRISCSRYLGFTPQAKDQFFIEINAHPPTAVLLGLPFAGLSYPDAVLAWNLVSLLLLAASLWLLARQLGCSMSGWALLPILTLALLCWPLRQHVQQGQLSLLLLFLMIAGWSAERSGQEGRAGIWLGLAAALKIFPGFLFLYFLFRRQWRVLTFGTVTVLMTATATSLAFGPQIYRVYLHDVPPLVGEWRSAWNNASLPGLWSKLFDPGSKSNGVVPLLHDPMLARWLVIGSIAGVVAVLARLTQAAETRRECDRAFGAAVIGMLLLAPVTWEHSFVLLLLPLAVLWAEWPASRARRTVEFLAIVLGVSPTLYYVVFHLGRNQSAERIFSSPGQALLVLSLQCYAMVGLFVAASWTEWLWRPAAVPQQSEPLPKLDEAPAFATATVESRRQSA